MSSPDAAPDRTAGIPPDVLDRLRLETKRPEALGVVIGFTVLSFIFFSLRAYTRFILLRNHGWEDYFIVCAMLCSIGMAAFKVKELEAGAGTHEIFLTIPEIVKVLTYLFGSILFYFTSCTFTKLSILFQYHRLFVGRKMKIAVNVSIGVIVVYFLFTLFINIFTCNPVSGFWDITNPNVKCLPKFPVWYATASLNVLTEIMIATLPLRTVYKLKLPRKQKYALLVVFALGYVVCITSALRVYALVVLSQNMHDSTWYSADTAYWSAVETNLGIVCACLPSIKPLIVRLIPRFGNSSGNISSLSNGSQHPNTFCMSPTSKHHNPELTGIKVTLTTVNDAAWIQDPNESNGKGYVEADKTTKEYV